MNALLFQGIKYNFLMIEETARITYAYSNISRITAARRAASILFFIWYHLNQQDTDTFPKVQRLSENFA